MMLILLIAANLIFSIQALEITNLKGKNYPQYMNYVFDEYLSWLLKEVKFDIRKLGKNEYNFINKNIKDIDHWITPEYPMMNQLSLGFNAYSNYEEVYFRIYVHKKYRKDPFLKKMRHHGEVIFYEWQKRNGSCFIFKSHPKDLEFFRKPNEKGSHFFTHRCNNGKIFLTIHKTKTEEKRGDKNNKVNYEEFLTLNEKSEVILTKLKNTTSFPIYTIDKLNPLIDRYYNKTMLSINEFSFNSNRETMIYVP